MKKFVFIGLFAILLGCQKDPSSLGTSFEQLTFETENKLYDNKDNIQFKIRNKTNSNILLYYHVPDGGMPQRLIVLYQQKENNIWKNPLGFVYLAGYEIPKILKPENTQEDSINANSIGSAGTYRLVIPFDRDTKSECKDSLYSNEFTIK